MVAYTSPFKFNAVLSRVKLAVWIATRARPYLLVEDDKFQDFVRSLNPSASLPSRQTVSRDVLEIHSLAKLELIGFLAKVTGRVHVIVDGWTSPNTIAFLGVVVQFVHKGKIESRYLDYVRYVVTVLTALIVVSIVYSFILQAHQGSYR